MNRPRSRFEIRKRAMLAFAARNRAQMLRRPADGETPLSEAEVRFGVGCGLIVSHGARITERPIEAL